MLNQSDLSKENMFMTSPRNETVTSTDHLNIIELLCHDLLIHQGISTLIHLPIQFRHGADPFVPLDFDIALLLWCCCNLESAFEWRLSNIKAKLELELRHTL